MASFFLKLFTTETRISRIHTQIDIDGFALESGALRRPSSNSRQFGVISVAGFRNGNHAVTFRSRSAKHVQVERVVVNALEMRLCV
jgi:hypothetical protein